MQRFFFGILAIFIFCPVTLSQTGNGTSISGEINVAYTRLGDGGSHRIGQFDDGSQLTFRAKEVIDASIVIGVKLQSGIDVTSGAGGRFGRDSLVWVQVGGSKLSLGRLLTIYDDVSTMWYFPVGGAQNPNALWANCAGGGGASEGCLDTYMNDSVRLDYRVSGEIDVSGSISAPAAALKDSQGRSALSFGIRRVGESAAVAIALQRNNEYRTENSIDQGITLSSEIDLSGAGRIAFGLETIKYLPEGVRQEYVGILFSRPMGNWTSWVSFGMARSRNKSDVQIGAIGPNAEGGWGIGRMCTVGIQRNLSKSVSLNAYVSRIFNQGTSYYTFSSLDALPARPGFLQQAATVGLQQRF